MSPPPAASPVAAAVPAAPVATVVPERPVQETETVVNDSARKSTVAAKPTVAAKRVEPTTSAARTKGNAAPATARQDQPPPLTATWPSSAAQPPATPLPPASETVPSAPRADEPARAAQDPPRAPEPPDPPRPRFEDLVIGADSVIGLRLEDSISSETARVEDRVEARVARDVRVNGEIAVPAGTRARGNVTLVEGGGKFKERARLGVRFHTLVLADGTMIPIQTETVYREGGEMANKSSAKIGGAAAAGALIGAIFGGGKGAAIGGAAGAGAGTAATMAGPRSQATLPAGSTVTVRLLNPATVTIEK